MKIINFADSKTVINQYVAELRDVNVHNDRARFRHNLQRIGQLMAFELSKTLNYSEKDITTPLGIAKANTHDDKIVLATIFRAGLPFHAGFLSSSTRLATPSCLPTVIIRIRKVWTWASKSSISLHRHSTERRSSSPTRCWPLEEAWNSDMRLSSLKEHPKPYTSAAPLRPRRAWSTSRRPSATNPTSTSGAPPSTPTSMSTLTSSQDSEMRATSLTVKKYKLLSSAVPRLFMAGVNSQIIG